MSSTHEKDKHGERIQQKENKLTKTMKLAREYGLNHVLKQPHKYHKQSPFNCGDPKCVMCGNPRKFFKEKTIQEKRLEQNLEE